MGGQIGAPVDADVAAPEPTVASADADVLDAGDESVVEASVDPLDGGAPHPTTTTTPSRSAIARVTRIIRIIRSSPSARGSAHMPVRVTGTSSTLLA
jgi:hypothetical protein